MNCLRDLIAECSRIQFILGETKNNPFSTKKTRFSSKLGTSEMGMLQLSYNFRFQIGAIWLKFDETSLSVATLSLFFVHCVNFEINDLLKNTNAQYLLVFDDSCDETCNSKALVVIVTNGGHRGLSTNNKHSFFHRSKLGRDAKHWATKHTICSLQIFPWCELCPYFRYTIASRVKTRWLVLRPNV